MLVYSKKVNGTYYVVEAIPDTEYKKFWVVSAYMNKKGSGTQAPSAQSPRNTPDASLASSLPKGAQSFKTETPNDVESGYRDSAPSNASITDSAQNSNGNLTQCTLDGTQMLIDYALWKGLDRRLPSIPP